MTNHTPEYRELFEICLKLDFASLTSGRGYGPSCGSCERMKADGHADDCSYLDVMTGDPTIDDLVDTASSFFSSHAVAWGSDGGVTSVCAICNRAMRFGGHDHTCALAAAIRKAHNE